MDYQIYDAGDVQLESGRVFRNANLAYKTYGTLNAEKSNVILYPTSFGAQHYDTEWQIGVGYPLDPSKYFIIIPNLFGNGLSSSPSNSSAQKGTDQSLYFTLADNVRVQQKMLIELFGITRLALVYGYSMGGQQALHWGALFPDMVERLCAICATAKPAAHTWLFLEGMRSILMADTAFREGKFREHPVRALKAFGRAWAPWGFSHAFYRQQLYRTFGAESLEEFLVSHWESRFLKRSADNLLAMLWTCQNADISANDIFKFNLSAALGAIKAVTIMMPSESDFYFPVEDARLESVKINNGRFVPIPSIWGHRAGNPQTNPRDAEFIFGHVGRLLRSDARS